MPTPQVVVLLTAAPPQRAVKVLLAMPRERIDGLLTAMDGRLIARMLVAADPDRREELLEYLDDARLAAELALLPMAEAARVMAALPPDRAAAQLDRVSSEHLTTLLAAMPGPQRRRLLDELDPLRMADLRRVGYEKAVIESLRQASVSLSWVPDDYGTNLFAGVMHRLFGVSLCYVDRGSMPSAAVLAAQQAFIHQQVHGLLVVTNAPPSPESIDLLNEPQFAGLSAMVVTWNNDEGDDDGLLSRALMRLAG